MFAAFAVFSVQVAILVVFGQVDWMADITKVSICRDDAEVPVCEKPPGLNAGYVHVPHVSSTFLSHRWRNGKGPSAYCHVFKKARMP